jgi:hypothetical protein
VHGERRTVGQAAELLQRPQLDVVAVHRCPVAVGDQDDEAVVRDAGEDALDDAARLVHAGHDDHEVALDLLEGVPAHDASGRVVGHALHLFIRRGTLDLHDALQRTDPDGAEPLCSVRKLQPHGRTLPESRMFH